jgi:hypothetical protein
LAASVVSVLQVPEQFVCPLGHVHAPLLQVCPAPHALPQAPQLAASVLSVTHLALHRLCPLGQAHALALHVCPLGQLVVQLPQ